MLARKGQAVGQGGGGKIVQGILREIAAVAEQQRQQDGLALRNGGVGVTAVRIERCRGAAPLRAAIGRKCRLRTARAVGQAQRRAKVLTQILTPAG